MPSNMRLRKRNELAAVYRGGRAVGGDFLLLKYKPNGQAVTRFAFSVPRKVGKAVVRNRWRRRLREVLRENAASVAPGYDVVVTVNPRAGDGEAVGYRDLAREVTRLLKRAGLCRGQGERA